MTIYLLVFVIYFGGQPAQPMVGLFTDRTKCEIAEGAVMTAAANNEKVSGWAVPAECVAFEEGKKV